MHFSDKEICIVTTNDGELNKIREILTTNNLKSAIYGSR